MKNAINKLFLGALLVSSTLVFAAPSVWNGSSDVSWYEPSAQAYNLINAEQLAGLAKLVNEGTSDFAGKTITLGANIFLNDTTGVGDSSWYSKSHRNWIPIGTSNHSFKGEFDGIAGKNNRKIYGLYVNSASTNYAGLFGYTSNVKISNLDVLVGRVSAKDNVGSLIGYAEGGSITNVYSDVKVDGNNRIGGLVGYFTGNLSKCSGKGSAAGQDSVGGLVGFTTGTIYSASHVDGLVNGRNSVGGIAGSSLNTIRDSYSEGNVISKGDFVGGLVGWLNYTKNTSTVTYVLDNSYVVGDVQGVNYVGGLIGCDSISGYGNSGIKKSYSKGRVVGKKFVGGVLGGSGSSVHVGQEHSIESSYHMGGNVIGDSSYVGGLVGITYGTILDSYNISNISGAGSQIGGLVGALISGSISNCSSIGNVEGVNHVGGLIGSGGNIDNSYAEGDVKGESDYVGGIAGSSGYVNKAYHIVGKIEGHAYVGGLAGFASTVDSSYSEGDVVGAGCYVGGLVGEAKKIRWSYHINGNVDGYCNVGGLAGIAKDSVMNSSHTMGNVRGLDSYIGGLIGLAKGYVISSYHKKGDVSGQGYVGGLIGEAKAAIVKSYSECNVMGTFDRIGGLAGSFYRETDTIKVSANDSNYISESYSLGNVEGRNYVGGLLGNFYRSVKTTGASIEDSSSIRNSYFTGNVRGQNFIGGLIGNVEMYKQLSRNRKNGIDTTTYTGSLYPPNMPATIKRHSALIKYYVINCNSKGSVEGENNVGGLIGRQVAHSDSSDKYISDSFITFKVLNSSHSDGSVVGKDYVGGLIGVSLGAVDTAFHMNGNVSGYSYAGGLIGQAVGPVTKSFSEGNVSGTGNNVGGLIGFTSNSIKDSYSKGSVLGNDSIGGLAGYIGGSVTNNYVTASFVKGRNSVGGLVGYAQDFLKSSYFEGDSVTGIYQVGGLAGYVAKTVDSSYSTANVKGDDNVGGLIGSAHGSISNSYAIGNVDGDVEHSSAGNDNLGGLVGYQYGGSISKSLALGNVSGTTKLGGLVGRFEGTSISQSYANGNVTGDYYGDPSDEVGNYYIGGLVGYAKGTVNESYASGVVKGIEEEPVYTGCVVGYVNGSLSVSKSYYDKSKCGLGVDGGENSVSVTGGPDKTTTEMQTQSTFVNWDFTDTWMIMENTYPFLQIFANSLLNAVVVTEPLEGIVYDGLSKTPQVTAVSLWNNSLIENVDYSVAYENNVNAGMAKISVCGKGLYNGCKTIQFEIAPATIVPTIAAIDNVVYTGLAFTPEISVYNGESLLDASTYTVEYKDNVNAGTAKIAITMKGNYSGTATKEFNIEKATPVVSVSPQASDITIGQSLARSILSEGVANVSGLFVWKVPTTIPTLVNDGYTVVFAPENDANYNPIEIVVPVVVWDVAYIAVHIDEKTLDSAVVIKGRNYTLPSVPDSVGYDFMGFYKGNTAVGNSGDIVAVNENTVIEAVYKIKTFVVNFVNGELELQSNVLAYGSLPEYTGEMPTKATTAQYSYTFKGWSPTFVNVTGAKTYTAVFDSVVNRYLVTFMDDEKELQSGEVEYGKMPTVPTVTLPENTAQYTYSFGGWDKPIVAVTGAVTYYAVINRTLTKYEITFNDYDGSILKAAVQYDYGTPSINIVKPVNPTRRDTVKYTYTFKGWEPIIADVTENAVYTAVYDSTIRSYQVSFVNANDILQSENVLYGEKPVYSGVLPVKSATKQYTYTFKSWNPAVSSVTGAATYTAVFDSVVNKYVVTFMNGDDELQSSAVTYGTVPSAPEVSLPENTIQYTYSFGGWDKPIVAVTGAVTYYAVINRALNKYEIAFKDYDDSVLMASVQYDYGMSSTNIVKPANPTRQETAKYIYTFKGWKPTVEDVTENAVYTAEYDSTIRSYQIVFVNGNDELQSESVVYGNVPTYNGVVPTKQATAQWTYTFKGWNPAISSVAGTATYAAVFDSVINKYGVSFKDYDGSILKAAAQYDYGTSSTNIVKPANPTRRETAKYICTFKGWNPTIADVTENMVYTAEYDSTIRGYQIAFVNGNDELQSETVVYGNVPTYNGVVPTKQATAQWTYTFKGWNPAISSVAGTATYAAVFDSVINKYGVSFKDYDGSILKAAVQYDYGTSSINIIKPANPARQETAKYIYTFKGWNPTIADVTGNAVYTAEYDSTVKKYTISFINGDKILQTSSIAYGEMPEYTGNTPTKASTKSYSYEFIGWSPKLESVTKETDYVAVFDSTSITGIVNVANLNMSIHTVSRSVQISAAPLGVVYALLDAQGRVLKKGRVESPNFNILIPQSGTYFIKVGSFVQRIGVK